LGANWMGTPAKGAPVWLLAATIAHAKLKILKLLEDL
jgi:hypothetical protein